MVVAIHTFNFRFASGRSFNTSEEEAPPAIRTRRPELDLQATYQTTLVL